MNPIAGQNVESAGDALARGLKLAAAGELQQALWIFDGMVAKHGQTNDPRIRAEVANALYNRSVALGLLKREPEAEQTLREIIQRFGDDTEPAVLISVCRAGFNLAHTLAQTANGEAAIRQYFEIEQRFGRHPDPAIARQVDACLCNLAMLLRDQQRYEEAASVCRGLLARVRSDEARAKFHRPNAFGILLGALTAAGLHQQALAVGDEILQAGITPSMPEHWVGTLNTQGTILLESGRYSEALAKYEAAYTASLAYAEPQVVVFGARALSNQALALHKMGDVEGELEVLDTLIDRFGGRPDPDLSELVASALNRRRARLEESGRSAEADAVARQFDRLAEQALRADDNSNAAWELLSQLGSVPETERLERLSRAVHLLEEYPGSGHHDVLIAQAQLRRGIELARQGRWEDAMESLDCGLAKLSCRQDSAALGVVAKLRLNRAKVLAQLGCLEPALRQLRELSANFADDRAMGEVRIEADDLIRQVEQVRLDNHEIYQVITLPGVLAGLADEAQDEAVPTKAEELAHGIHCQADEDLHAARIVYSCRDPHRHEFGETGYALVASFVKRIRQDYAGRVPRSLVNECKITQERPRQSHSNAQLLLENMAVFGLPLHLAASQTHLGRVAESLHYDLAEIGLVPGAGLIFHFISQSPEIP